MTVADLALAAFVLCSSARVLAYVPQIIRVGRDRNGASAISLTTWLLFAASNASTSGYAIVQTADWTMAGVFAFNTLCCLAIVGITAWKRLRHTVSTAAPRQLSLATSFSARRPSSHRVAKEWVFPFPMLVGAFIGRGRSLSWVIGRRCYHGPALRE